MLQRIQQVLGEQRQLRHAVESMNRAVQLEEVRHVLKIERTDLRADGLDASPLTPSAPNVTANATAEAAPPLEINASILDDAKKRLEQSQDEQKTLQERLSQLGVSMPSLARYGLEGTLQPVETDDEAESQKNVEMRAGPRLLSIAEALRQRRGAGTSNGVKPRRKRNIRVPALPTLSA